MERHNERVISDEHWLRNPEEDREPVHCFPVNGGAATYCGIPWPPEEDALAYMDENDISEAENPCPECLEASKGRRLQN